MSAAAVATGANHRGAPRRGYLLSACLWTFYCAVAIPFIGLAALALLNAAPATGVIWSAGAALTLRDTLTMLAGVGLLSTAIGLGAAWLIAMYRFPGRAILAVLLVLPMAIPTYLAAYIAVEITDYFGPLQGAVRAIFGFESRRDYWFFDLRSMGGAIIVLSLVLYPYVYIPARLMFERQGATIIQAARLQGARGWRLFLSVGAPLARPAIAGGAAFILLETLNDVGAVEHLGVQSVSLAIRSIWLNRGDLAGAAQLAMATLALAMLILFVEFRIRRRAGYANPTRNAAPLRAIPLAGWKAIAATALCAAPALAGFVIPAAFLTQEAAGVLRRSGLPDDIGASLGASLTLGFAAAAIVAGAGALVALSARILPGGLARHAPRLGPVGYAIPGTVLVIALLPAFRLIDDGLEALGLALVISGSATAILIAYVLRFIGIGVAQADASLGRMSHSIDHAARTLGAGPNRLAFGVLAPNIVWPVATGALLVLVDAMKELPATLLLRPLNMETLATSLYAHASRGSFEEGAVEALALLLIGLLPVTLLARLR